MKIIFKIFFLIILLPVSSEAQESEIDILKGKKKAVQREIDHLKDSLSDIENEILNLQSLEILKNVEERPLLGIAKAGAYVLDAPNVGGKVLFKLKEDSPIELIDSYDRFFQVCVNNKCGYMAAVWINENNDIKALKNARTIQRRKEKIEQKQFEIQKAEKISKAENDRMLKKYGESQFKKMKEGIVWLGMNKEMLEFTLGPPQRINKSVYSFGVREQWVYSNRLYFYFKDGILTSYQN